jgi:hypothetical protein
MSFPTALYLFCFADSKSVVDLEGTGINGDETLFKRDFLDITAIGCETPLDLFTGPSAEQRLQDLNWVAPRAVRHSEVIVNVMRQSPVLPARFGALFSSEEKLLRTLEKNHETISSFLETVRGKDEWGVKCMLSREEAKRELIAKEMSEFQQEMEALPPGKRYFAERRKQAELEKGLISRVRQICRQELEMLTPKSAGALRRKIVQTVETGGIETVANWAFLVERRDLTEFSAVIARANRNHNHCGLFFSSSGPWPPYSFCPPFDLESEA